MFLAWYVFYERIGGNVWDWAWPLFASIHNTVYAAEASIITYITAAGKVEEFFDSFVNLQGAGAKQDGRKAIC